jgi:hypothetical protein
MLERMYASGCRAIFFGMETASPRIQQEINKKLDLDKSSRIVRHSAELGIYSVVSYMLGFPGETEDDLNLTMRSMITETAFGANVQVTLLSLLPGTEIYSRHQDELVYDGSHSGFSPILLTGKTESLIREHPEIFSSFYHVPNRAVPRDTYLFLSDLGNYLEQFIPTLSLIRDYILDDLQTIDLYRYIVKKIPEYPRSAELLTPELFFLADSLFGYLDGLDNRYIPPHVWEVFHFDFTKAFMIAAYQHWGLMHAGLQEDPGNNGQPGLEDRIHRRPYWSIVSSKHYLYDYIKEPGRMRETARFRRGRFNYLLLPVSHRKVKVLKIPGKELPVYNAEDNMSVGEIVKKNVGNLPEDRILHIIRRMKRLGLIDISS